MRKKDGLVVSKSCVQPVQSLRVACGGEYILYAGLGAGQRGSGHNHGFIRSFRTPEPTRYPHRISAQRPLLRSKLSTLYTGPIITITTYINKYLHNR
jgi:hypothetical protein